MCQLMHYSMNHSFEKVNATKNFKHAHCAVIVTPKRQLLVQKHDVQIVNISPPVFCTADPFNQPPKSYVLQCL